MIILAILTTNISNIDLPPHSVTVRQLKGILSIVDRTFKLKSHIYIYKYIFIHIYLNFVV